MTKKSCFGYWLDTEYEGFPECRTCEDLKECIQEFKKRVKDLQRRVSANYKIVWVCQKCRKIFDLPTQDGRCKYCGLVLKERIVKR